MKSKLSKVSKKSTKTSNPKKPSKNPSKKPSQIKKDTISKGKSIASKKISITEQEMEAQSLPSNKSQVSDINILSKYSEMPKVKTYEIISSENIAYLLSFEQVKDKIKITILEKDSFPLNKYENYYSLEDLIKISNWFNIFYNIENLLIEFEQLTKNESFVIEQKNRNVLSLFIIFPIDLLEKIEIQLPINEINNLDLFSQLISKINEIESKDNSEMAFFDEKIENLGHLLQNIEEANKAREEEMLQNQQNLENQEHIENQENPEQNEIKENEGNIDNENKNNLEEMKDALKLQIEQKIKNDNEQNSHEHVENNNENENIEEQEKVNDIQSNEQIVFDQDHLLFLESNILSRDINLKSKELELLRVWLTPTFLSLSHPPSCLTFKMIYDSENEDDKAISFHNKCDNIAPTLVLIETKEGFRYGGFTTQTWESPEQSIFKKDKFAFIFSLDTEKKYEVIDDEKSIQCSKYWGPYFGEGGAICVPDNFLDAKDAFYQWPSSYNTSEKDEFTFGQEHNINISRYEVFEILIDEVEHDNNNNENEQNEHIEEEQEKEQ